MSRKTVPEIVGGGNGTTCEPAPTGSVDKMPTATVGSEANTMVKFSLGAGVETGIEKVPSGSVVPVA